MIISVEKLYEFLDSTIFLNHGDILELLGNIVETGETKVKWCGKTYDLSAKTRGAIEALEQDAVLDKIKAEIEEEEKVEHIPEDVNAWHYIRALDRALSIINKYKVEVRNK